MTCFQLQLVQIQKLRAKSHKAPLNLNSKLKIPLLNQIAVLAEAIKLPSYLADFYVDNGSDESHNYCYFMNIPISYKEAVNREDLDKWEQAMDEEFNSLEINDTFTVTNFQRIKKLLGGNGCIQ